VIRYEKEDKFGEAERVIGKWLNYKAMGVPVCIASLAWGCRPQDDEPPSRVLLRMPVNKSFLLICTDWASNNLHFSEYCFL
jgi:hypothetical protein